MLRYLGLGLVMLSLGCEGRRAREHTLQVREEPKEYVIAIAVDLSGSYRDLLLGDDGKAWHFLGAIIQQLSTTRAGAEDRVILAQISGAPKALLWEGSLPALRRSFPSAAAFRTYLLSKANASGSRVHESIADLVDYVTAYPGVKQGHTKSAVFVLSDMENNLGDEAATRQRLLTSLTAYARTGGTVGMYWVDSRFCSNWQRWLKEAGFPNAVVENEIVANPLLPRFED